MSKQDAILKSLPVALSVAAFSHAERGSFRAFGVSVGRCQSSLGPLEVLAFGNHLEVHGPDGMGGVQVEIDIRPALAVALDLLTAAKAGNLAELQPPAPSALDEKARAFAESVAGLRLYQPGSTDDYEDAMTTCNSLIQDARKLFGMPEADHES